MRRLAPVASVGPFARLARYGRAMIGVTVSGRAYAAMAGLLPAGSTVAHELAPDGEYLLWLPRDTVNRLRALRAPEETFSDVILRLAQRGSFAALMR
jgi:hypothetical protein